MLEFEKWSGPSYSDLHVEVRGRVVYVTIDAPPVNAFTIRRYERLTEIFSAIGARDDLHCAVLTAAGSKAFCAGLDLHEFLAAPIEDDGHRQEVGRRAFVALGDCPIPVIAAVNGPALGAGAVFAALCDIRIASDRATFGLPEINVGRCGGASYVARWAPEGTVRQMFFTGEAISATEAHRVGLVQKVVAPNQLLSEASQLADAIAAKSPLGLRLGKAALNEAEGRLAHEGYAIEQVYSTRLLETRDAREALKAVVEKRAPVFEGR